MCGKRKYSDDFRLEVVMEYLSGKSGGVKPLADKYGIDHKNIDRWVRLYELHGAEGLCKTSGTYSGEFKVHVVEYMHAEGLSLTETANRFCIPSHACYRCEMGAHLLRRRDRHPP